MIFALLPVKNPRNAKQRLEGFLPAADRERFARLLYEQTIAALCQASGIDRVAVVTSDPEVSAHARRLGAAVFEEDQQCSHSASADAACLRAIELGAVTALLVPIDVPLATAADFEQLAASARPGVVIVPSADGTGTNALVRTPPDVIPSCFGPGSFHAHLDQARTRGVAAGVLRLPGLMFDIDTPEDITELLERAPESPVASFLRTACASK
ncbi:MAG: 2-phospho-L-lactate guanylyltransferase [Terriglobia bacterium]|nr:MAG: 2-phospho-L-lactate guanylyltransferase [Terriglobia bacterium]